MKKNIKAISTRLLILSFAGCWAVLNQQQIKLTLSPDLADVTEIVAKKYTQVAETTINPATPFPSALYPTMDWAGWTPSTEEIVASDSGNSFDFWVTSRFSIVLKESENPAANLELHCNPEIVLGRISNVEPAPLDYYVMRYEGVRLGQCTIQNGQFEVTINVIDHP